MSTWGEKLVEGVKKVQEFVDAHTEDLQKAGDVVEAKTKEAVEVAKVYGGMAVDSAKEAFEEVKKEIKAAANDTGTPEARAEDKPKTDAPKGPEAGPR